MTETELRLPPLTGDSAEELRRYLYRLTAQLEHALETVNREQQALEQRVTEKRTGEKSPAETFSAIKSLIIKSADVVYGISTQVEKTLEGVYVAKSEYGDFVRATSAQLQANSTALTQSFRDLQTILPRVEGMEESLREMNACIRTGLLYENEQGSVYGVEIGQQTRENGVEVYRKYVRLTADRLSFYDSNDREVALISDSRLYITTAEVGELIARGIRADRLHLGGYQLTVGPNGNLSVN